MLLVLVFSLYIFRHYKLSIYVDSDAKTIGGGGKRNVYMHAPPTWVMLVN